MVVPELVVGQIAISSHGVLLTPFLGDIDRSRNPRCCGILLAWLPPRGILHSSAQFVAGRLKTAICCTVLVASWSKCPANPGYSDLLPLKATYNEVVKKQPRHVPNANSAAFLMIFRAWPWIKESAGSCTAEDKNPQKRQRVTRP